MSDSTVLRLSDGLRLTKAVKYFKSVSLILCLKYNNVQFDSLFTETPTE